MASSVELAPMTISQPTSAIRCRRRSAASRCRSNVMMPPRAKQATWRSVLRARRKSLAVTMARRGCRLRERPTRCATCRRGRAGCPQTAASARPAPCTIQPGGMAAVCREPPGAITSTSRKRFNSDAISFSANTRRPPSMNPTQSASRSTSSISCDDTNVVHGLLGGQAPAVPCTSSSRTSGSRPAERLVQDDQLGTMG